MTLADRIIVLNNGDIEQIGSPQELYSNPATRFVASFIGSPTMNFIGAQVVDAQTIVLDDGSRLAIPADRQARYAPYIGRKMVAGIRPEHLQGVNDASAKNNAVINVNVDLNEPLGAETLVHFKINGAVCCASVDPAAAVPEGTVMPFAVAMDKIHLIDPLTDRVV
jgi:multiple sugar transport system ATP-binding protein